MLDKIPVDDDSLQAAVWSASVTNRVIRPGSAGNLGNLTKNPANQYPSYAILCAAHGATPMVAAVIDIAAYVTCLINPPPA